MAVLLIGILSSVFEFSWWFCLLFFPAAVIGVLLAERVRKKHGSSVYWSKPMNTPDLKETWEIEKEREAMKDEQTKR